MKSELGEIVTTRTRSGLIRYNIEIRHSGLHKYQVVTADNKYVVQQKALAVSNRWNDMWNLRQEKKRKADRISGKKEQAIERTDEAQQALATLEKILAHTLSVNDAIDWDSLKNKLDYPKSRPNLPVIPQEPKKTDETYRINLSFLDKLISSRRIDKVEAARINFEADHKKWQSQKERILALHANQLHEWTVQRQKYLKERDAANSAIDEQKRDYLAGKDVQAIIDYCDLVLSNSNYPDYFPQQYELGYDLETKLLIVDYELPAIEIIPTLREVKYIQSRDEFTEKHISQAQSNKLYDNLLYQIALRTLHELYESDQIKAITSIVFNGFVNSIDPATGQKNRPCILSVHTKKEEFELINLGNVEPKACFKNLKGISATKLSTVTPVAPLMILDREDSRFVSSYDVAESVQGENLASMDWEDFEHLIRELFEKEFATTGGEVKVTRASRDGGIDAVVFDPDPIRGGKIVIQAKRYTNTVGVSAVRDLYGTLINEGANKGILVTTANYGPDAHDFAKGKPITLLSGNQLLYLLEKHGHKARIDLKEAKQFFSDKNS